MPRWCWRLLTLVAIVWSAFNIYAFDSYSMALSTAAGYCLAQGIRGWEREQERKAASNDHPHSDGQ
jgi:hypothetical protein